MKQNGFRKHKRYLESTYKKTLQEMLVNSNLGISNKNVTQFSRISRCGVVWSRIVYINKPRNYKGFSKINWTVSICMRVMPKNSRILNAPAFQWRVRESRIANRFQTFANCFFENVFKIAVFLAINLQSLANLQFSESTYKI